MIQLQQAEIGKTRRERDKCYIKDFYLNSDRYTPNRLINFVMEELRLQRDWELADKLGVPSASISHIRVRRQGISARIQLRILELLPSLSLAELQRMAGLPKGA